MQKIVKRRLFIISFGWFLLNLILIIAFTLDFLKNTLSVTDIKEFLKIISGIQFLQTFFWTLGNSFLSFLVLFVLYSSAFLFWFFFQNWYSASYLVFAGIFWGGEPGNYSWLAGVMGVFIFILITIHLIFGRKSHSYNMN